MRFLICPLLLALPVCASITNDCASTADEPCHIIARQGELSWRWQERGDQHEEIHLGFTKTLTFTGRAAGTTGYLAFYAVKERFQAGSDSSQDNRRWIRKTAIPLNDGFAGPPPSEVTPYSTDAMVP